MAINPRERPRRPFDRKEGPERGSKVTPLAFAVLLIAIVAIVILVLTFI